MSEPRNREVEVKAMVADLDLLLRRLADLGCTLSEAVTQKDRVYIPSGSPFPVEAGTNVLRIRQQPDKYLFTLKQHVKNQLDCIEKEIEVKGPDQLAEIIRLLGFKEVSYVEKSRRTCKYRDMEICVDSVKGLGQYMEVEKMVPQDTDGENVQSELFEFLKTLGIEAEDRVLIGYDVLMYMKERQQ